MTARRDVAAPERVSLAAILGAVASGVLIVFNSKTTLVATVAVCAVCLGIAFASRLAHVFLRVLWALLVIYAVLGKGGAYLNVGGIFVGEMVLALGLLAAMLGTVIAAVPRRSWLVWGVVAFGLWGAARTVPYISRFGTDALRDAVVWGYAAFALIVAGGLLRTGWTARALEVFRSWLLWIPLWVPVLWALSKFGGNRLPMAPGTNIPLLYFKAGDAAFHLAAVAAFVLLGMHRPTGSDRTWLAPGSWVWWGAWLIGFAIVGAVARGSMLAIILGGGTVMALRPSTRLWRPALASVALGAAFVVSGIRVEARNGRFLSADDMISQVRSIGGSQVSGDRNATAQWRLEWWRTIVDYTIHGPYFWTGKGYGVNLATADGFVVGDADHAPLRSPHNGHLTILARSGVPGAVLWLLLQAGFAAALIAAYRKAAYTRADSWARVNLWILACWVTFLANAAFEVSLEGPQGGIWFWSLFGLGLAVLEVQRRSEVRLRCQRVAPLVSTSAQGPEETRVSVAV
jgi:O-antigen ligase